MSVLFDYNVKDDNPLVCSHGNTHERKGVEKCTDCGAVYDATIMEWVTPEEGA